MKWKIYNVLDYAQRPTGRKFAECPFCNYLTDDFMTPDQCQKKLTNYCPNCGANMMDEEAVDAVPVVRCKDCKWWKTNYMWNGSERKVCVIEAYEPMRNESDYCSRGERKENGTKTDKC